MPVAPANSKARPNQGLCPSDFDETPPPSLRQSPIPLTSHSSLENLGRLVTALDDCETRDRYPLAQAGLRLLLEEKIKIAVRRPSAIDTYIIKHEDDNRASNLENFHQESHGR